MLSKGDRVTYESAFAHVAETGVITAIELPAAWVDLGDGRGGWHNIYALRKVKA